MSFDSRQSGVPSSEPLTTAPAAILIVHGGHPSPHVRWLSFCVARIAQFTPPSDYHLFIWNDRPADTWVSDVIAGMTNATLLTANTTDRSAFPNKSFLHADRLQRLYDRARSAGYRIIVTMDTDAHPLRPGWLDALRNALADGAALAGVWHDEQRDMVEPFVHPSCSATTVDFIERYGLRFDEIKENPRGGLNDTLCHFTSRALANHHRVFRLSRSNRNQFHPIMGGVYGDLIYHHGGGSRQRLRYLGQLGLDEERIIRQNLLVSGRAAQALVQDYDRYLAWLTLSDTNGSAALRPGLVFVMGMHRSGTSCLTGALGACGCTLGDVDRTSLYNPSGNLELPAVIHLNNRILTDNGGAWDRPPAAVRIQSWHQDVIGEFLTSFRKQGIGAVKDPRMLLVAQAWLPLAGVCSIAGTFRHPLAVTRSLARRNGMPEEKALQLWCAYNSRLLQLHKQFRFPLIEFQLESPDRYRDELAGVVSRLGLEVDRSALDAWVRNEEYAEKAAEQAVPKGCRAIFDYLRLHSIASSASPTQTAKPLPPLVFVPGGDGRNPSSFPSLRRLGYQSLYRLSLVYHYLPYRFRVSVRQILAWLYARIKRSQAAPIRDPLLKPTAANRVGPTMANGVGRGPTHDPGEAA